MFWFIRLVFAFAIVAFPLVTAAPAFADDNPCKGTYYDQSAFEFFTPE